jgi:hypothetical protein
MDPDKDRENNFRDVVEDQFDFEFFDLCLEMPCFQSFSELSFENGEYGFDLVSLMILGLVKRSGEFSSISTEDPFSFSGSDRDERISVQIITDKSVNIFRIISFIEDVDIGFSCSMTLNEEFFRVRNIMDRLLGDLEPGDDLKVSIDGDRGFQESFSRFTGSPGIVVAGVRTGEPG